jgi:hypothetical protein
VCVCCAATRGAQPCVLSGLTACAGRQRCPLPHWAGDWRSSDQWETSGYAMTTGLGTEGMNAENQLVTNLPWDLQQSSATSGKQFLTPE